MAETNLRAATFLALLRRDNKGTLLCKAPNVACGNRCIPPTWECRIKGQGSDSHSKAVQYDPVQGTASVIKGSKDLAAGAATLNVEKYNRGKNSLARGLVKLYPSQDLQHKKKVRKVVDDVINPIAAIGLLGMTLAGGHNALKLTNLGGYRGRFGAQVDIAVRNGMNQVLDRTPVLGALRAERARATGAVFNGFATQAQGLNSRATQFSTAGREPANVASRARNPRASNYIAGPRISEAVGNRSFKSVDEAAVKTGQSFEAWQTARGQALVGWKSGGSSPFAEPAANDFLSRQFGGAIRNNYHGRTPLTTDEVKTQLTAHLTTTRGQLVGEMERRGLKIGDRADQGRFWDEYRPVVEQRFARLPQAERDRAVRASREAYRNLIKNSPADAADQIHKEATTFFNNYFQTASQQVNRPPVARNSFAKPASIAVARHISKNGILNASHANWINQSHYNDVVLGSAKAPVYASDNSILATSSSIAGRPVTDPEVGLRMIQQGRTGTRSVAPVPQLRRRATKKTRSDAAKGGDGLGKPCGASFIPKDQKCHKGEGRRGEALRTAGKVALGLGALAGGLAIANKVRTLADWRKHPDNPRNKPPSLDAKQADRIIEQALAKGDKAQWQERINARRKAAIEAACRATLGKVNPSTPKLDAYTPEDKTRCYVGGGAFGSYYVHPSREYGIKHYRDPDDSSYQDIEREFDMQSQAHWLKAPVSEPLAIRSRTMVMQHLDGYKEAQSAFGSYVLGENSSASVGSRAKILKAFLPLHLDGMAHGDIHGGNVLFNPKTKKVALVDFGYATQRGDHPYDSNSYPAHNRSGAQNLRWDLVRLPQLLGLDENPRFMSRWSGTLDLIENIAEGEHSGSGQDWDVAERAIKRYYAGMADELRRQAGVYTPRSKMIADIDQPRIPGLTNAILKPRFKEEHRVQMRDYLGYDTKIKEMAKKHGVQTSQLVRFFKATDV